jgi:hypothetical protein
MSGGIGLVFSQPVANRLAGIGHMDDTIEVNVKEIEPRTVSQ